MPTVPGILFNRRVLVVHNGLDDVSAAGRATAALIRDLRARDIDVIDAASGAKPKRRLPPTRCYRRCCSTGSWRVRQVTRARAK